MWQRSDYCDRSAFRSTVRQEYVAARSLLNGQPLLPTLQEYMGRRRNITDKPVAEIVDELLESRKHALCSKRYIQTLRSHLSRFAMAFQTHIGSITTGTIEDWLVSLKLGPCGRNNVRCSLVTFFHFARSRHYLPKGESTEADDIPKVKDRGGKIGILRPQELAKLLSEADAEAALYLALGAFTGMRSAELIRLEWSDINFERGYIVVAKEKAKTATRRLVPIQPNLMQWLAPYRGRTGRVFVSEHAADRTISFAKKHITWPSNALRHSYATYRLAATADMARVALEMGNSPGKLITNYRELADDLEATAWFSIVPDARRNVVQFVA